MSEPGWIWSGARIADTGRVGYLRLDFRFVPWPYRLWAVLSLPYQLVRFIVTGRLNFIDYRSKR